MIENWQKLFYIIGLVFLLLAPFLVEIWYFQEWISMASLVSSLAITTILGIILVFTYFEKARAAIASKIPTRIFEITKRFGLILEKFFQFDWFYRFVGFFVNLLEKMLNSINAVLEGEGGILWALVFLVLLISLISSVKGG